MNTQRTMNTPHEKDFEQLDLDPIKVKLTDPTHGKGWSHEKVETVAIQYRRFLTLVRENPSAAIVPTEAIDEFWHHHILDTGKYAADCNEYFGYFVHHFPYLGLRGADDVKRLAEAFEATTNLYERRFGESLPTKALSSADCSAGCGSVVCSVGSCTDSPANYERPQYIPRTAAA
jgi:hypothetical protein